MSKRGPPIGLRDCVKRLILLREIVKTLFLLREFVKWHPCVMREKQKFHAWIRENPFFLRECVKRPACVMRESPKVSTLKSHNAGLLNTEVIYLKKQLLLDSVTLVWRSLVTISLLTLIYFFPWANVVLFLNDIATRSFGLSAPHSISKTCR